MKKPTKKEQAMQFASRIFDNPNVKLFTCSYGKYYSLGLVNETGSIIRSLTPSLPLNELVAFLGGVCAMKANPEAYVNI